MKKNSAGTERTVRAGLYREAARIFERREYNLGSCLLIGKVAGVPGGYDSNHPLIKSYTNVFKSAGFNDWTFEDHGYDERATALCFMAAMVEAGDA